MSDKNLGPVILERKTYFTRCLEDHLYCQTTYKQLTQEEAEERTKETRRSLNYIRLHHRDDLTEAENLFFQRNAKLGHRLPQFYITIKVHKSSYKTRPIISCIGSFLNAFSKWLDHRFKTLISLSPTYIKNSAQIIEELKEIGPLPSQATLFTCDAISMYTNIDSSHGPEIIAKWIEDFKEEIPDDFPTDFFIKVLKIVMNSNIFQFDNTYWLQTCGTAMGTSCACAYATLYWAYMERKYIIPKWKQHLPFIRRFIDDKFGIWTGTQEEFQSFTADLNSYCQLKWTTDGLSTSVNFLDLTIYIDKNRNIITKTFQKECNLHLYIPPHSAHPPGVLKSIVYGNLRRYWHQNTYTTDFISIAKQFANRLIARGHNQDVIYELFVNAAKKLDGFLDSRNNKKGNNTLYLHWTWHPRDISRAKLRLLYNETLSNYSGFDSLTIAYSRAKNLRDSLMTIRLSEPEGTNISNLINGIRRGT